MGGRPAIAAYWDDLASGGGNVYTHTNGLVGQREFIIQWEGVTHEDAGAGTVRFQIVMSEQDRSIRINYDDVTFDGPNDNGQTASIGVQGTGGEATGFSFNGAPATIQSGSSIVFTQPDVDNPRLVLDVSITDDSTYEPDERFRIQLSNAMGAALGADEQTVTISENDNVDPVAQDDNLATTETQTLAFNVLTNPGSEDTDANPGQTITVTEVNGSTFTDGSILTLGSGALLTINSDGSFNYDPNGVHDGLMVGQTFNETVTYTVSDGVGGTDTATVTIVVNGENLVAILDLDDDGTTPSTDNTVTYQPSDPETAITASNALLSDGDDTSLT